MTWLRITDTSATHPIVLEVMNHPDADERSVDEVFGYMMRLSTQAAQHFTDYVIGFPTAVTLAGTKSRAERLLLQADFAGYGAFEEDESGRRRFKLVDDPEFIHMIRADEDAFNKQRKIDNANTAITAPVRCRDGDVCRYCGNVVNFNMRRGRMAGTYDHRPPGQPGSVETTVVACKSCNSRRGNQPVEVADLELPLLDPPAETYYHLETRQWLQGFTAVVRQYGLEVPALAPRQKNLAPGRPAPGAKAAPEGVRRATGPAAPPARDQAAPDPAPRRVRPAAPISWPASAAEVPAEPSRTQQDPAIRFPETPGRVGTGRVESGRSGSARSATQASSAGDSPPPKPARRRGRRGGRSRKSQLGES